MTPTAVKLARVFHEAYERRAPQFEREMDTRDFDEDSPNGQLMIAVCEDVLEWLDSELLA